MKTIEEIVQRCRDKGEEVFDFTVAALGEYLPFDMVKEFLSEDVLKESDIEKKWNEEDYTELTRENVINDILDYMEFALEKAESHRGLSANRSISRMNAWVWVLGDEDKIDWDNYANYGVPILKQICELYGYDFPMDNKVLVNMSEGRKCKDDCEEGCGKGWD